MSMPDIEAIRAAHERVRPYIHCTPVLTSRALNDLCQAEIFFKCENLQKAGAFKIRGATNAVFSLTETEAARGVATHSSGNHAAALALAASWRGVRAYVVMPANAPEVKKRAVAGYGAEVSFCEPTLKAREQGLARVIAETGAAPVHPYDDDRIIAGQATAGLELCQEIPGLQAVLAPVGGGGLLSGTALAVTAVSPGTRVYGAEPERADDAFRSLQEGRVIPVSNPDTVADGLRTSLCERTFSIIQRHVSAIVTVGEEAIVGATRLIWERMKIVVEPSAAVPLAVLLSRRKEVAGRKDRSHPLRRQRGPGPPAVAVDECRVTRVED